MSPPPLPAPLSPPLGAACGIQWTDNALMFAARTDVPIYFDKSDLAKLAVMVGAYGLPVDSNFKSVDSVVPLDPEDDVACVLFQATISSTHGINATGLAEVISPFDELDKSIAELRHRPGLCVVHRRQVVLLFAVSSENFASFNLQNFTAKDKKLALDKLPPALKGSRVWQGVILI